MPFTSEAVVACWSSPRNIFFLSPCRGLDPWQCQDHPRSCGVSNETAWVVFSVRQRWGLHKPHVQAHTSIARELFCALWSSRAAEASLPARCCICGHLLQAPAQRRACQSQPGPAWASRDTKSSPLQHGSPANGPWLTDYQQRLSNRLLI